MTWCWQIPLMPISGRIFAPNSNSKIRGGWLAGGHGSGIWSLRLGGSLISSHAATGTVHSVSLDILTWNLGRFSVTFPVVTHLVPIL